MMSGQNPHPEEMHHGQIPVGCPTPPPHPLLGLDIDRCITKESSQVTPGLRERSAGSFPEQRLGSNRTNCTNKRNVQYGDEDIITRVHPFPRPSSSDMNVFFMSHSVVAKFVVNKCTLHCWKPRPVPFQLVTGQYFTFANSFVWNE